MPRGHAEMARVTFVGNRASVSGGAINGGPTGVERIQLGNGLIVKNIAPLGGGFNGRTLELINSTVADNQGGGINIVPMPSGASATGGLLLINSIVSKNMGGNCGGENGSIIAGGPNIQFPDIGCGASIRTVDPLLDMMYVPYTGSPARFAGEQTVCNQHKLVNGQDVYGSDRPTQERCAVGAVEHDLERHAIRLLQRPRELPENVREFFEFLHVSRPKR